MAFYMTVFFLVSLNAPAGWGAAFGGIAGIYAVAFFGLVAGYFWARWFAMGVGISWLISAAISMWQVGPEPVLIFLAATHAAIPLALWGDSIAAMFDGRPEWREKFHLDEHATRRLGKSIIRVGVSLPYIVMYALAPKEGAAMTALAALALVGVGGWALTRMRTWGVVAMAGGAAALVLSLGDAGRAVYYSGHCGSTGYVLDLAYVGAAAALLLGAAIAPFAAPALRYLRDR